MKISKDEIQLDCLDELQAAKWFLSREKQRHLDDVVAIDKDLERLSSVDIPEKLLKILGHHFNVPTKTNQTLFDSAVGKTLTEEEINQIKYDADLNPPSYYWELYRTS